MKDILVFSEDAGLARELVSGARALADAAGESVCAFAIGDDAVASDLIAYGADKVLLADAVEGLPLEAYASLLANNVSDDAPAAVFVGATNRGKGFAAMLAAALNAGCSTEARNIRIQDGRYVCERMLYGGLAVSTESAAGTHVMTVQKMTFEAGEPDAARTGAVDSIGAPASYGAKVVAVEEKPGDSVDLAAAKSILAFGRGVDKEEDISMVRELAGLLGAELGCTRPIAEDFGWMPKDRYIGLSGKTVKPSLYFLVGSSGQIQQMAGAQDSKIIAAVCKDENAPIFQTADYAIVGDLYEVVPALVNELKKFQ